MRTIRTKWLVAGGIILLTLLTVSFMSVDQYSVYYYTPQEVATLTPEQKEREIKVGGMVKAGSVHKELETIQLSFTLSDLKGHEIMVSHHGTPPDMFKENSGVIAEGRFDSSGVFVANKLLVKHSEEYKKPDGHPTIDSALIEKSMFKNEKT
jgi:cytochrome c-type biogenesis protein CcmE